MMKRFLGLVLGMLGAMTVQADRDSSPTGGKAVASGDGTHFMLVVPATSGMRSWFWTIYRMENSGAFKEVWSSDGIWAREMFLSNDGESVVCVDSWPSGTANQAAMVLATYRGGTLLRAYRAKDLVRDMSEVMYSASHYRWLCRDCPIYAKGDVIHFSTIDGQKYQLDMRSGEASRVTE